MSKSGKQSLILKSIFLAVVLLCLTLFSIGATRSLLTSVQQNDPTPAVPQVADESYGPVLNYDSPEPTSPQEQSKRASKNGRLHREMLEESPDRYLVTTINGDWLENLSVFPVALSDAIVLGEVVGEKAYLSSSKTGVFSEFSIHIENVLRNKGYTSLTVGSTLMAEREGGRVRFASGHIQRYRTLYQGMPRVGRRYVLFLRRTYGEVPYILTGYELRQGKIFPVDGYLDASGANKLPQFAAYESAEEKAFLSQLQNAIMQAQ